MNDSKMVYARFIYEFCNEVDTARGVTAVDEILTHYGYDPKYDGRGDWVTRWIVGENVSLETLRQVFNEIIEIEV